MTLFRAIAFVAFVIGAVLAAINDGFADPVFWVATGLAAFALTGASFDQHVG